MSARAQAKIGPVKIAKTSLPEALTQVAIPADIAERYTTGSSAAAVSDLTLEQAIGVQVRQPPAAASASPSPNSPPPPDCPAGCCRKSKTARFPPPSPACRRSPPR